MNNSWLRGHAALVLAVFFVVSMGVVAVPAAHAQGGGGITCIWVPAQNAWVVDNTADISPPVGGAIECDVAGNIIVTNAGALTPNGADGIFARTRAGDVRVANSGTITTSGEGADGIVASTNAGDVRVANSGTITTSGEGADGIFALTGDGDVSVTNSGAITTSGGPFTYGIYAWTRAGDVRVVNSGAIMTSGPAVIGIVAETEAGDATVVNSGVITTSGEVVGIDAVTLAGDVRVVNSGAITTSRGDGIFTVTLAGDVSVANSGAITTNGRSAVGIRTGDGNDTVTNSGDITAKRGSAIDTGAGKDTVIIQGGTITGLIDGGDDWDRLAFSAVLDPASYESFQAQLASADPAGGTITFRGESYTYANFEELLNWLVLAMLHDGRINPFDFAATVTGYCAGGGAQFYAIHADGTGEWAYNVTDGQVQVALAQAFATGQHVLIADRLGVQLWALADRSAEGVDQLQLMGPDYLTIFPANTCGFTD